MGIFIARDNYFDHIAKYHLKCSPKGYKNQSGKYSQV